MKPPTEGPRSAGVNVCPEPLQSAHKPARMQDGAAPSAGRAGCVSLPTTKAVSFSRARGASRPQRRWRPGSQDSPVQTRKGQGATASLT